MWQASFWFVRIKHSMDIPQPLIIGIIILVCLIAYKAIAARHQPNSYVQDPRRDFTKAERRTGFERAGNRCEMSGPLGFGRCRRPAQHGDHHYPWSRGGATNLSNFVAACAPCNLSKSNKIPTRSATRGITRRRKRYFPQHTPTDTGSRYGLF